MRHAMTLKDGRTSSLDAEGIFKVAAERDDATLAKAAVRCFGVYGYSIKDILLAKPPSFVDGIPPRYYTPYYAEL